MVCQMVKSAMEENKHKRRLGSIYVYLYACEGGFSFRQGSQRSTC